MLAFGSPGDILEKLPSRVFRSWARFDGIGRRLSGRFPRNGPIILNATVRPVQ